MSNDSPELSECADPECSNITQKDYLCEDCEPSEQEIEEAKKWAEQYRERWRESLQRLEEKIEECRDCTEKEQCERHEARAELAFSGGETAKEVDENLQSLELRQFEEEKYEQW